MTKPLLILIGTMTGTSEVLADELKEHLESKGYSNIHNMLTEEVTAKDIESFENVFIVISTWGDGELPDGAIDLHDDLKSESPDLSAINYAICALGDHDYDPYFCEAGKQFDILFSSLGASRITETYEVDGDPTDVQEEIYQWALRATESFV